MKDGFHRCSEITPAFKSPSKYLSPNTGTESPCTVLHQLLPGTFWLAHVPMWTSGASVYLYGSPRCPGRLPVLVSPHVYSSYVSLSGGSDLAEGDCSCRAQVCWCVGHMWIFFFSFFFFFFFQTCIYKVSFVYVFFFN